MFYSFGTLLWNAYTVFLGNVLHSMYSDKSLSSQAPHTWKKCFCTVSQRKTDFYLVFVVPNFYYISLLGVDMSSMMSAWKSGDNFVELILSLHHMAPWDGTWAAKLVTSTLTCWGILPTPWPFFFFHPTDNDSDYSQQYKPLLVFNRCTQYSMLRTPNSLCVERSIGHTYTPAMLSAFSVTVTVFTISSHCQPMFRDLY